MTDEIKLEIETTYGVVLEEQPNGLFKVSKDGVEITTLPFNNEFEGMVSVYVFGEILNRQEVLDSEIENLEEVYGVKITLIGNIYQVRKEGVLKMEFPKVIDLIKEVIPQLISL